MTSSRPDASHRDLRQALLATAGSDRYRAAVTIRGLAFDDLIEVAAPVLSGPNGSTTTR